MCSNCNFSNHKTGSSECKYLKQKNDVFFDIASESLDIYLKMKDTEEKLNSSWRKVEILLHNLA